jgi:hypothetical protein
MNPRAFNNNSNIGKYLRQNDTYRWSMPCVNLQCAFDFATGVHRSWIVIIIDRTPQTDKR